MDAALFVRWPDQTIDLQTLTNPPDRTQARYDAGIALSDNAPRPGLTVCRSLSISTVPVRAPALVADAIDVAHTNLLHARPRLCDGRRWLDHAGFPNRFEFREHGPRHQRRGWEPPGWKIAATTPAMQKRVESDEPIRGRTYARHGHAAPGFWRIRNPPAARSCRFDPDLGSQRCRGFGRRGPASPPAAGFPGVRSSARSAGRITRSPRHACGRSPPGRDTRPRGPRRPRSRPGPARPRPGRSGCPASSRRGPGSWSRSGFRRW